MENPDKLQFRNYSNLHKGDTFHVPVYFNDKGYGNRVAGDHRIIGFFNKHGHYWMATTCYDFNLEAREMDRELEGQLNFIHLWRLNDEPQYCNPTTFDYGHNTDLTLIDLLAGHSLWR